MTTNKIVVILLVIAILFSVATVVIALGIDFGGMVPAGGGNGGATGVGSGSAGGEVALTILTPPGGSG